MEKIRLGIAPIAWTNDDMPDLGKENTFSQCVSEMALAGFTGCEIGNKYPKDAAVLDRALKLRGLSIASAWFSSFLTTKPYAETEAAFSGFCDFLARLGADRVNVAEQGHSVQGLLDVPVLSGKPLFTDAEWDALARGLDRLGLIAKQKGLRLCYHHHMGTGVQTAEEIDRLMDSTDPSLVSLLFDSGHLVFSGIDPEAVLRKYAKRIAHVHLKDVRSDVLKTVVKNDMSFLDAVRAGVFTVPGDGMTDFAPLFAILKESGYEGWYIVEAEQDPAKADPLEYAIKARKYIKDKAGI